MVRHILYLSPDCFTHLNIQSKREMVSMRPKHDYCIRFLFQVILPIYQHIALHLNFFKRDRFTWCIEAHVLQLHRCSSQIRWLNHDSRRVLQRVPLGEIVIAPSGYRNI